MPQKLQQLHIETHRQSNIRFFLPVALMDV